MDPQINFSDPGLASLKPRDKAFLQRVYSGDKTRYTQRIRKIGFSKLGTILDAGAGYGQWSLALATEGNRVVAIDADWQRCNVLSIVSASSSAGQRVFTNQGHLEDLPYQSNSLDGVFAYSSIYFSNYPNALSEFFRVLKKGGKLYINTNDFGWYLFLLFTGHNQTKGYNPRSYALKSIINSAFHKTSGFSEETGSQYITVGRMRRILLESGFRVLAQGGDGTIDIQLDATAPLRFLPGKFLGMTATYEVLTEKI